jgi:prepilin-type N-terminal cleavage/methylation domain-containing protein
MKNAVGTHGFTLVEIVITMAIMVILLGLGVVSVGNMQAQARDNERKNDIEIMARGLEQRYNKGNSYSNGSTTVNNPPGAYPGGSEMWDWLWYGHTTAKGVMPGTPEAALKAPSGGHMNTVCIFYWAPSEATKCASVEREAILSEYFSDGNGGYKDVYLYEFVSANNTYCNEGCVRYNLYWISEVDKTIYKGIPGLKVWRSKHQ